MDVVGHNAKSNHPNLMLRREHVQSSKHYSLTLIAAEQ